MSSSPLFSDITKNIFKKQCEHYFTSFKSFLIITENKHDGSQSLGKVAANSWAISQCLLFFLFLLLLFYFFFYSLSFHSSFPPSPGKHLT